MENQNEVDAAILQKGFGKLLKLAEEGNAEAQHLIAVSYFFGKCIEQDREKAAEWFQKAAEQGLSEAQFKLGCCCKYGEGVPLSYEKAAEWWQKAAEQGHPKAQYYLGWCYEYGEGVPISCKNAAEWYQKAAEQGDSKANLKLYGCNFVDDDFPSLNEFITDSDGNTQSLDEYEENDELELDLDDLELDEL